MTSDNGAPSEAPPGTPPLPGGKPSRPAPTIELGPNEFKSEPRPEAKSAPESKPAAAAAAPKSESKPEPPKAKPASAAPPPPPSRGGWRMLGAGIVGGAMVAAAFWGWNFMLGRDAGPAAQDQRLTRIEQQLRDLAGRAPVASSDRAAIDELTARLARLETALASPRPGQAADPALANRIATLEGEVKAMAETVGILGRRSDEIGTVARDALKRAEATAAALAELTQRVTRLATAPVARSDLDAVEKRLDAVERAEKAAAAELAKQAAAGGTDKSLRLAVIAAALKGAVERGEPYAAELAAAKALTADPKTLAPLEAFAASGLPTAAALARELAVLTPALQQAAGTPPRDGILDKLAAGAERLVRIRPLDEVAGSDPSAIISRAEVKAANADLAGALAELAKLSEPVRAPAEAWIKKAQARAAAVEASRRFAAAAFTAVAK